MGKNFITTLSPQQAISKSWLASQDGCLAVDTLGLELWPLLQLLTRDTLKNVKRLTSEGELSQCEETHK